MDYVLTIIISVVAGILLFMLKQKMKENKELRRQRDEAKALHEKALSNGVLCLLRQKLMDEHDKWIAKGYITAKALESWLLMYKAYKDLGGNGMIDHMEEEIQSLSIRD